MPASISNCDAKLRFQCPQVWNNLLPTSDPDKRFCDVCQRSVLFCRSEAELAAAASAGQCVAFDREENGEVVKLLGDLMPPDMDG